MLTEYGNETEMEMTVKVCDGDGAMTGPYKETDDSDTYSECNVTAL